MGWKTATVIVNNTNDINFKSLLEELGFTKFERIEDEPYEVAMNPGDNTVFIGKYKDILLITSWEIADKFFYENNSAYPDLLIKLFPRSEICSLVLHSGVNLWGYAVIKDGQLIRARSGSAQDGTFIDIGEPLPEEMEILSRSTLHEDGTRTYSYKEYDAEPMSEDQVGEEFVFAVSGRYFDEQLHTDDLLFDTMLEGYTYTKMITDETVVSKKPWWKFW